MLFFLCFSEEFVDEREDARGVAGVHDGEEDAQSHVDQVLCRHTEEDVGQGRNYEDTDDQGHQDGGQVKWDATFHENVPAKDIGHQAAR